jgi:hypothetical protein
MTYMIETTGFSSLEMDLVSFAKDERNSDKSMLLSTEKRQPSVLENSFDSPQLDSTRLKTLVDDAGSWMHISKTDLELERKKRKKPKRSSKQMPETSLS